MQQTKLREKTKCVLEFKIGPEIKSWREDKMMRCHQYCGEKTKDFETSTGAVDIQQVVRREMVVHENKGRVKTSVCV